MNLEHFIRPSGLALLVKCAASAKLQASVPLLPPTEEELEGEVAHHVAMRYAMGNGSKLPVGSKVLNKGREWTVDLDMVTGAKIYERAITGGYDLRLEDPVSIPRIHPKFGGTPDAWHFLPNHVFPAELGLPRAPVKLLRVADYKYGHRFVEVFENYQLSAYTAGVMQRLNLTDNDTDLWVELILVQPRSYHHEGPVRVWRGPAHMLRSTINVAHNRVHEAWGDNPIAATSDQCIDCKARHACKTLQHATNAFIDFSSTGELVEMPADAMGQELAMVEDAIKRLEARATGLAAQAEALLRQGKPIAFYHMTPGLSRRVYKDDVNVDEVVGLGDLLGIDLRKPQTLKDSLVTPTQAIALGVDEATMKSYSYRPPAAYKLTRDDALIARKVFSK